LLLSINDINAIDSENAELGAQRQRVFEVERVLIIISNDFKHIEKRMGCLRVVYISRSQMFQKMGMKGRPPSI